MHKLLRMYTIYENPRDYPGKFVVLGWSCVAGEAVADPEPRAVCDTLQAARRSIWSNGLACLTRSPNDDPCIVETWL